MIFIDNKYTRWYFNIITSSQCRALPDDVYTEKHHIVPKSLGGTNLKSNIALLTAKEHFICHRLLPRMTAGMSKRKMTYAQNMMLATTRKQNRYVVLARVYAKVKEEFNNINHFNDPAWQEVQRKKQIGKIVSAETRKKQSEAWTTDRKIEVSKKYLENKIPKIKIKKADLRKSRPTYKCEYCNDKFDPGNFTQFHGENCKAKYGLLTNQQKIQKRCKKEKKVSIDSVIYNSLTEASKITGISLGTISFRASRSKNFPEYFLL